MYEGRQVAAVEQASHVIMTTATSFIRKHFGTLQRSMQRKRVRPNMTHFPRSRKYMDQGSKSYCRAESDSMQEHRCHTIAVSIHTVHSFICHRHQRSAKWFIDCIARFGSPAQPDFESLLWELRQPLRSRYFRQKGCWLQRLKQFGPLLCTALQQQGFAAQPYTECGAPAAI